MSLANNLVCLQMVLDQPIATAQSGDVTELGAEQRDDLFALVNLVQPGYFRQRTAQLGHYYGIYQAGQLVAVTGERMKTNAFTEVSAIVTHPDHGGRGYATRLIAHAVNNIFAEHKTPYLHVAETNTGAIKLYEKLGFRTRRKISFWHLKLG